MRETLDLELVKYRYLDITDQDNPIRFQNYSEACKILQKVIRANNDVKQTVFLNQDLPVIFYLVLFQILMERSTTCPG